MHRLWGRSRQEQIDYHLRRNDAPEFDQQQPGRIDLARFLIDKILKKDLTRRPLRFIELGCGAGDITGPYSGEIEVHGYDVVPVAQEKCATRWPEMKFHLGAVEDAEPQDCDLLVMCEFLEHVDDPIKIVTDWLPRAKWAIIGHPLNEPDPPYETGHIWSYTQEDWYHWFEIGGHHVWERLNFPMGYWDTMVIGHSCRMDQPPFAR
jgi:Methyltransferase domain